MSKKNSTTATPKTEPTPAGLSREEIRVAVQQALDSGELEMDIPDDLIVGKYHARLSNLEAMVRSLTRELNNLKAAGAGTQPEPESPAGRIDPVEAAKKEKPAKK